MTGLLFVLIYFIMWVLLAAILYARDVKHHGKDIANADFGADVLLGFFWWGVFPLCAAAFIFSRSIRFVAKMIQGLV